MQVPIVPKSFDERMAADLFCLWQAGAVGAYIMWGMTKKQLILNRYKPLAEAGAGGFGTVQVAWDTRIQRKVAIKCIPLSEADLHRATLPGADALVLPDEEPVAESSSAAGEQCSAAQVDPADIPPWEDVPQVDDAASATKPAADDSHESLRDGESAADAWLFSQAGMASAQAASGNSMPAPGESVSLTQADADEPLVRTLSRVPGLDEARTAAMLSDPNIVAVYDFEIQDSTAYLIMEYVEGMTLTELLRDHDADLSLDVIAAVFDGVAHALEVAHENGVLHLDIKPDNILINHAGQVKVTDFGLATLADASGFGPAGGGTIGYMPLEQMRQENLDARCDEWALASVTYEMLAGENPFFAPDLFQAQEAIEDGELVLPSLCWDDLDSEADDVIFYALDPERDERYETVRDFAEELEPFLGDVAQGRQALAAIVQGPPEEEPVPVPRAPRVPLRERITPMVLRVASHVCGAAGSGVLAFVSCANISQTAGFNNPLFWGLVGIAVLAGALRPHLGALLGLLALSSMLIACGIPAAGCVLLVASGVWWWYLGRRADASANAALAVPLAGSVGLGPLAPLVAGFSMRPLPAMATAAFQVLCAFMLASLGSSSLMGWDVLSTWHFSVRAFAGETVADCMVALLQSPGMWAIAASWVAAAGICALLRWRPTRAFAVFGTLAATALLAGGLALAAASSTSGQAAWALSAFDVASLVVSAAIMLFASYLLPDSEYDDEGDE